MTVESNQFLVEQPVPGLSLQLVLLLMTTTADHYGESRSGDQVH